MQIIRKNNAADYMTKFPLTTGSIMGTIGSAIAVNAVLTERLANHQIPNADLLTPEKLKQCFKSVEV